MLPKPKEISPMRNTPSPNKFVNYNYLIVIFSNYYLFVRFGFCSKPATKLIQPTTHVKPRVVVERRSQSEPQRREISKPTQSGSKIVPFKITTRQLPRPQVSYKIPLSPNKTTKEVYNNKLKNETIKQMKQGVTIRNFSDSVELTEIHAIPSRPTISSNAKGPLIIKRANSYLRLVVFTDVYIYCIF